SGTSVTAGGYGAACGGALPDADAEGASGGGVTGDPACLAPAVAMISEAGAGRGAMTNPFFTIGHSTRTSPEFVDLLRSADVRLVVDVRSVPRSRTNPQFNRDALPDTLGGYQIGYEHVAALGGLRGRQRSDDPSPNTFWENRSFRNYADYA